METIRTRATDSLPSVLLTLLSMIQALALELLWTAIQSDRALWEPGWPRVVGWVQVVAMGLGMLQVWLFYVGLVMRFRWAPSTSDSILPFGIGLLEFSLIDLMGIEALGPWFCMLAGIFAVSVWTSHGIFRRARQDPSNREFFRKVETATWRDHVPAAASIGLLLLFGIAHWALGDGGGWALVTLGIAISLLGYQAREARFYWIESVGSASED